MGEQTGGGRGTVVVRVAVAGTGWWVGVLDCAEEVHCPRCFLETWSVARLDRYVQREIELTVGATLRDAMIAV